MTPADTPTIEPPPWLPDLLDDPDHALDALLQDRVRLGRLSPAEPSDLLTDWVLTTDAQASAAQASSLVDVALAGWIQREWGRTPEHERASRRISRAWISACNLVASLPELRNAAEALAERFDQRELYLGPLSVGPSRDPLGRYLLAVANHQHDRSLEEVWWVLLELPPDVPYYHGAHAITGVRQLPPREGEERGGFRPEVAYSVFRLGLSLERLVDDGRLSSDLAREEFESISRVTIAAYPFLEQWREVWYTRTPRPPLREWAEAVLPPTARERREPGRRRVRRRELPAFDTEWPVRAGEIANGLKQDGRSSFERADRFLQEQRQYADAVGDSDPLAKSLCNFAVAVRGMDPGRAVRWAGEARRRQPWDPYPWNIFMRAMLEADQLEDALFLGWQAIERFPDNEVAWNDLGSALDRAGHLAEAEGVFLESIDRFPTRPYGWRGLADVLRRAGDTPRAERLYRAALERFPDNEFIWDGLGNVLKAAGRYPESAAVYREAVTRFPDSGYSWRGLAMALKGAGELAQAEDVLRQGIDRVSDDEYLKRGLAGIRDLRSRHGNAERIEPEPPLRTEPLQHPSSWDAYPAVAQGRQRKREERAAILNMARVLRRAARRRRESGEDDTLARDQAVDLLDRLSGVDVGVGVERVLLALEEGDLGTAVETARRLHSSFAGASATAYALARAEREAALEETRAYTSKAELALLTPLSDMSRLDLGLRPLELLGRVRASFALRNGPLLQELTARNVAAMHQWISSRSSPDRGFQNWWASRISLYLFADLDADRETLETERIAHSAAKNSRVLDSLEEDLSNRASALP